MGIFNKSWKVLGLGFWVTNDFEVRSLLHYLKFHLADAFNQSNLQLVHSTMRVQTQNNKNQESTISSKNYKVP